MDDHQLLKTYLETGSQQAFAELVSRHVDLVYSAALRQCEGNVRQAQEVTQMVFTDLALKARKLAEHPLLLGWLHRACFLAAKKLRRGDMRRRARETAAATDPSLESGGTGEAEQDWSLLKPVIDEALASLSEADRDSILQRILAERSFTELGRALGVSENSARMRHNRALERLQGLLAKRGIRSSASALALALAANTVQAAPTELAVGVAQQALFAATAAEATVLGGLVETIVTHKLSLGVAAGLSLTLGVGLLSLHTAKASADARIAENQALLVRLQNDNETATLQSKQARANLSVLRQEAELHMSPAQEERTNLELLSQKGALDYRYAFLYRHLRLSPEKLEQLKTLLVLRDRHRKQALDQAKQAGLSEPWPSEVKSINEVADKDANDQLRELLGNTGFAYYQAYERGRVWLDHICPQHEFTNGEVHVLPSLEEEDAMLLVANKLQELEPGREDEIFRTRAMLPYPQVFIQYAETLLSATRMEKLLERNRSHAEKQELGLLVEEAVKAGVLNPAKPLHGNFKGLELSPSFMIGP